MSDHRCAQKVFREWASYPCGKRAKVERNGVWYCGRHDPVAVKKKNAERVEKWNRELAAGRKAQRREERMEKALMLKGLIYDQFRKEIQSMRKEKP